MGKSSRITVRVQQTDFDLAHEQAIITSGHMNIGAVVAFTGLCRDENGTLAALELEHYPGMAEVELTRIATRSASHWNLQSITVIHRFGRISPGDNIVLVITASRHRASAFEAAENVMDYLKTQAPFWKKQHFIDGSSSTWVAATDSDDIAAERWS